MAAMLQAPAGPLLLDHNHPRPVIRRERAVDLMSFHNPTRQ